MSCNDDRLINLKGSNCDVFTTDAKWVFMNRVDSTGAINEYTKDQMTLAYIQAQIEETDPTKRWYVLDAELDFPTSEKGDARTEETPKGNIFFLGENSRTLSAQVSQMPAEMKEKFDSLRSQGNLGVMRIDDNGLLGYSTDLATKLKVRPIPVAPASVYASKIDATTDATNKMSFSFQIPRTWDESLFRSLKPADIDLLDSTEFYTLVNGRAIVTTKSAAGDLVFDLLGDYDAEITSVEDANIVIKTYPAGTTLSTASTTVDGNTYTRDLSGETLVAGNQIQITITRPKFDFYEVNNLVITLDA